MLRVSVTVMVIAALCLGLGLGFEMLSARVKITVSDGVRVVESVTVGTDRGKAR